MVSGLSNPELKTFLEEKSNYYNNRSFIESDPIQIPHSFNKKEDIEISAFLTSIISWGLRKTIIKNAFKMMRIMDNAPHDFILNATKNEISKVKFVHRTFNEIDFRYFLNSLSKIYKYNGGLENVFTPPNNEKNIHSTIHNFKKIFFKYSHHARTTKHIADPFKGSACKRINMFLRWMVRNDKNGVDFGLWKDIDKSILSCPLDVHSGNVARKLGLLNRTQNDHKSVLELDKSLKELNPLDPVKYDFALFGLGVFEKF